MKVDRLIGILALLLQREKVTAPELAARFEVSRRTIGRDIDALCCAGIPVVTAQGAGGGISLMEGYSVDRGLLTSTELRAILEGLRSLDSVSGTDRYAALMEKLCPGAAALLPGDPRILIDLSSWYGDALRARIERIRGAIEARRAVGFRYLAPSGESRRAVEPGFLVYQWSGWYLWGWCRMRADFRLFKLNRMLEIEMLDAFPPRPVPLPDLSSARVFPPRYAVKAVVPPRYRWRLVEEYGENSFAEREDGMLLFSASFADADQVIAWILSFRGEVELIEPAELRPALREAGERLLTTYGTGEGD